MKTRLINLCMALALITCQQTFGQEVLARSSPRIHTPTSLPLRQALKRLEQDYGVSFLVQEIWMDYAVTPPAQNYKSVDQALNALLLPLRLRHHKLRDGFYSITTQTAPLPTSNRSHVSTPISGRITTEKGEPLPGVSVIVVGTVQGTITGSDGRYSLTLNPGSYTVRASFVGYETTQRDITVGDEAQEIDFILKESVASLDEVVVLGSRATTARTNIDKPVPVDVIQPKEFKAYAQNDLTQVLNYVAPSFNANRQTVSDGTDHIDPASLRGLGPDQVLVLVNGKRRHTTALVNINGTFGRGTVGTDMNSIPVAAIERVEVLRDGAAAQYGSDAIAGVINLVMKKQSPLTVSTTYGQSWSHALGRDFRDGANRQVDISKGFALGTKGSLNVAGQILDRGYTNRGGLDTRPLLYSSLPSRTATESEADFQARYATLQSADDEKARAAGVDRNNMRVGNADSRNLGVVVNGEYSLGATASVYAMAGYTYKTGKAAGFYRLPSQSSQVDLTLYPNGFLPFINTTIHDGSFIGGVRGELGKWSYDLSHVYGHNDIAFDITNTVNASLPVGTSPTVFYSGKLIFNQNTTNLDLSRKFELSGFLRSLNVAYGAEHRSDHYQIQAGEERSWSFGYPSQGIAGVSGKAAGAQVFPGFRPSNVVDAHRSNTGLYADVEGEMGSVLVGAAARFEHYTDFGSNLSYKVTARWKIYQDLALRGGVSTGFRASSLHQRFFNNESTQFVQGQPTQVLTANNSSDIVRQFGVGSLKPETSRSYTLGLAGKIVKDLTFTLDAYQIDIDDRIVFSSQYTRERDASGVPVSTGKVNQILNTIDPTAAINSVQFFTNAIATRTRGLDVVLTHKLDWSAKGKLTLTAAGNINQTRVRSVTGSDVVEADPALKARLFDRLEQSRYELAIPRSKFSFSGSYTRDRWTFLLRAVRFGTVGYRNAVDPNIPSNNLPAELDQNFSARWVTDIAITCKVVKAVSVTLGANNLFDIYPDRLYIDPRNRADNLNSAASGIGYTGGRDNTSNGRFMYSRNVSQFGFNGRYVFAKITVSL